MYAGGCIRKQFSVAIDVGHTYAKPGATSARGRPEFEFNLELAKRLRSKLVADGVQTILINGDGKIGSLLQRTASASGRVSLFISLHHDSVQPQYLSEWVFDGRTHQFSDNFNGYSLFISAINPEYERSKRFAKLLGQQFRVQGLVPTLHHAEPISGESRELLDPALGIYRFDHLVVLRTATMPAVLVEAGIIVNRAEEEALSTASRQDKFVAAVTKAVNLYCDSIADE